MESSGKTVRRGGSHARPSRAGAVLGAAALVAGLWLISLNLRIGVASVGPVLSDIRASLGLSAAAASLLTTIPAVAFGAFAFLAPWLTRRVGLHRLLGAAMAALTAGLALRLQPGLASLFLGTVVVGAAIAIANVVMPAAIKHHFPHRVGLAMGVYSTSLFLGAAIGDGLTVPLLPAVGGNWRAAVALWAIPAAAAFVAWLPQSFRSAARHSSAGQLGAAGEHNPASQYSTASRLSSTGQYGSPAQFGAAGHSSASQHSSANQYGSANWLSSTGQYSAASQYGSASGHSSTGQYSSAGRYSSAGQHGSGGGLIPADRHGSYRRDGRERTAPDSSAPAVSLSFRALLTDHVAIAVTVLMGVQCAGYYAALTWLPTLLQDDGMAPHTAGWMLSFSAFPGIAAALVSPVLARRTRWAGLPIAVSVLCDAAAYAGLAVAPLAAPYLWMTLLGLGQGAALSLSLSYIAWRAPDARHTAHLSTMAQGFGYLMASLGPIGIGAVHAASGNWTVPLIVLSVLLVPQLITGALAGRERYVRARRSVLTDDRPRPVLQAQA